MGFMMSWAKAPLCYDTITPRLKPGEIGLYPRFQKYRTAGKKEPVPQVSGAQDDRKKEPLPQVSGAQDDRKKEPLLWALGPQDSSKRKQLPQASAWGIGSFPKKRALAQPLVEDHTTRPKPGIFL